VIAGALEGAGLLGSGGGFRRDDGASRRESGAAGETIGRVPLEEGSTPSVCK
jgi:hypothetical protein